MSRVIKCKVRFNASRESLEKFGEGAYLVYLPFGEDAESHKVLESLLSKKLGVVPTRIEFAGIDANKNWVFELL